jgi:DNA-binding transcriptional ArsR family regulator
MTAFGHDAWFPSGFGEGTGDPQPPAEGGDEDPELIKRLSRLARVLGDPLAVRIAAALVDLRQASPVILSRLLREPLDEVARKVRTMQSQGAVEVTKWVPERTILESFVALRPSLRDALPAIAYDLVGEADRLPPSEQQFVAGPSREELAMFSYYLVVRSLGPKLGEHRDALVNVGRVLSNELRVRILFHLVVHEHAGSKRIAQELGVSQSLAGRHIRHLAEVYVIRPVAGRPGEWTVTDPMKRALGGFYEYLITLREMEAAATPSPDAPGDSDADHNGNGGDERNQRASDN